jgi:hypothetical protein
MPFGPGSFWISLPPSLRVGALDPSALALAAGCVVAGVAAVLIATYLVRRARVLS